MLPPSQTNVRLALASLRYEYPEELAPDGQKPIDFLRSLVRKGAAWRYPDGVSG